MIKLYGFGAIIIFIGYLYVANEYKSSKIEKLEQDVAGEQLNTKVKVFEQYVNDTNLTTKEIKDENIKIDTSTGSHSIEL